MPAPSHARIVGHPHLANFATLSFPHTPQVYSVEEKRALALFNYEEKAAREARLMQEFKAMLAPEGTNE